MDVWHKQILGAAVIVIVIIAMLFLFSQEDKPRGMIELVDAEFDTLALDYSCDKGMQAKILIENDLNKTCHLEVDVNEETNKTTIVNRCEPLVTMTYQHVPEGITNCVLTSQPVINVRVRQEVNKIITDKTYPYTLNSRIDSGVSGTFVFFEHEGSNVGLGAKNPLPYTNLMINKRYLSNHLEECWQKQELQEVEPQVVSNNSVIALGILLGVAIFIIVAYFLFVRNAKIPKESEGEKHV